MGFSRVTLSPELNKENLSELASFSNIDAEILAYGRLPLMTMQYCPLSHSNKCPKNCNKMCKSSSYELKDRLGFVFKLYVDSFQTVTTLYNSKITWLPLSEIKSDYIRLSFLEESESEKKDIINSIISGHRFEGENFTNANFSKDV